MATRFDLTLNSGDDTDLILQAIRDGAPVNLTGKRVELLVKPSRQALDIEALYQLSTVTGGISITDSDRGLVTADLSDRLGVYGHFWYRAWVAAISDPNLDRETFAMGVWYVQPV